MTKEEKKKQLSRKEVKKLLNNIISLFHRIPNKIKIKNKNIKQNEKSDSLQEIIDYLRDCVKYMLLDIESYQRENKYLRKLLKDKE